MRSLRIAATLLAMALLGGTASAQMFDQYGGYTGLKGTNTSGFFRVEKINGRYWLVTPDNNVFWSTGITTIQYNDTWGGYCPTLGYYPNPYGNKAKYASATEWTDNLRARMTNYGFNTAACWGDGRLTSFTECIRDLGLNTSGGSSLPMVTDDFPDVWDPRWETTCNNRCSSLASNKNNPYTIGSFPYNECRWTRPNGFKTLPDAFIAQSAAAYGKQHWVNSFLKGKYATVSDLNTAYGTTYASWDDVLNATTLPDDTSYPARLNDKIDFIEDIADRYYSVATYYMRLYDPNHLVFTTRWAMWSQGYASDYTRPFNERIWKKAGQYCDVFANNGYVDFASAEANYQHSSRVFLNAKKPFMVTENAYFADDSYFKLGQWAPTQMDRANGYANAIKELLDIGVDDDPNDPGHPAKTCMGMHWFQHYDEPSLGRPDGEANNYGLFNCQDEGFLPLLEVAKTVNSQIYDYAANGADLVVPSAPTAVSPLYTSLQKNENASSFQMIYYMDHPALLHQVGVLVDDAAARRGKAWFAAAAGSTSGQAMTYGPYTSAKSMWSGAQYTITYRLKTSSNTSANTIATVDVATGPGAAVLVSRAIKGTDFAAANAYQDFTLTFTVPSPVPDSWQFRVYTSAVADIFVDNVQVSAPSQASFVNGPLSDGSNSTIWSSAEHTSGTATEWAGIYLGSTSQTISTVSIVSGTTSAARMPVDFRLQYSVDGTNWSTIPYQIYTDYWARIGSNEFSFQPVTCNYIRIYATKLGQDTDGKYRLVLAGIDVIPKLQTATPTFSWSYSGDAASYTLLLSPVAHFPDIQTIRVPGITSTSYTPSVPLAQGTWYWTVKAVDSAGHEGKYFTTARCDIAGVPFSQIDAQAGLRCEQMSNWRNVGNLDTGGDGYSFGFLDDSIKSEGQHSIRVAITVNSLNKTTSKKNVGLADIPFRYAGCGLDYSGIANLTFDVYPKRFCDSTGAIVPSTKYVRFRMIDVSGSVIADQAIDSAGVLPLAQWSTVTVPLSGPRRQVSVMEFYVQSGASKLTWDERVNFSIDNFTVVPVGDLTPPTVPVVTVPLFTTTGTISASISTQDPETGIADYQYAIGTSAGLDDIVSWRSNGQSPNVSVSGLSLVDGSDYYVSAKVINGFGLVSDTASSAPIRKVSDVYSIPAVRALPLGSWVGCQGQKVTARLADRLYIEEPDRSSGIGVITGSALSVGDVASVFGQTQIVDHELVINGGSAKIADGSQIAPVAMAGKALGGSRCGLQDSPVDNAAAGKFASGLTNIGCLVTAFGKATYLDPWGTYLYLDDGSGIADGSGQTGVRIDCTGLPLPIANSFCRVTGVMSVTDVSGRCARKVRARSAADLLLDSAAPAPINCGFEAGDISSWSTYGTVDGAQTGVWFGGISAHTGSFFFGTVANGSTKTGGAYQRIAVPAGYSCQAAVWSRVYHSDSNWVSAINRVGIDPSGGTNSASANIKWSTTDSQSASSFSEWHPIKTPAATCSGGYVTIFLDVKQYNNAGWHISCYDDVVLTVTAPH